MKTPLLFLLLLPLPLQSQLLLPGDANNDGRVNHLDLLAIGLNFGQAGPPRLPPFQGVDWTPKPFPFWPTTLPATGINDGFSDSDGDGVVSAEDILALKLNYDSAHTQSQPPPQPYAPPLHAPTTARPKLVFLFDKDTATVNDTLRLNIFYVQPPALPPALSPMGVAFTLEFDGDLIKDSLTAAVFEPSANDLHFAAGANGFADARKLPPGRVEFSVTGEHAPRLSFSRPIGRVDFIIEELIIRADTFYTDFKIDVSKVLFLDTLERFFDYDIDIDEVVLFQPVDSFALCPGDANNDGRVNSLDVLALGLNFKKEGNARKPKYQGIGWGPKPFEPWLDAMPATGINLAFSDSDGDGAITENDVKAIQLHYDSTHHLAYPASQPYAPPPVDILVPVPPRLVFDFVQEQVKPGDTLDLRVSYTPPEGIPDDFYPLGTAFALGFQEALVQDSLTRVDFPPDADVLVAAGATRFALARGGVPPGRVEIGVAGKGAPALAKPRELCTVSFVVASPLPPNLAGVFQVDVNDVLMLTASEQSMLPVLELDKVDVVVAAHEPPQPLSPRCYPSPFRENLWVESPEMPLTEIEVYDMFGRLLHRQPVPPGQTRAELRAGDWPTGVYWISARAVDQRTAIRCVVKK